MITRILVADDDPAVLRMLERLLKKAGYDVLPASGGEEAIRLALAEKPSIIITDWSMPEMDGLELCRVLRSLEGIRFVYIILLTAHSEEERIVEAFEAGADDFLRKPVASQELLARLKAGMRIVQLEGDLEHQNSSIRNVNRELVTLNRKLEELARTDPLTGVANRREAMQVLASRWQQSDTLPDLSCMLIDIDYFKRLNDRLGHAFGDQALCETAQCLMRMVRPEDAVCRIGGEEFLVICPGRSLEETRAAAETIREAVRATLIVGNGHEASLTISIGVAQCDATMTRPDDLLRRVDQALYAAKNAGRDRVCTADETSSEVLDPPAPPRRAALLTGQEATTRPTKVLVVDDDSSIRALSRRILETHGYTVVDARDGAEALELVPAEWPDVVVMDAHMPVLDGLECSRRLKADPATRDIPIIMASASTDEEDVIAGLEAGVDEYITKPLHRREFPLRVQSMARLFRSKVELMRACDIRDEQARALTMLLDFSVGLSVTRDLETILDRTVAITSMLLRSRRVSLMLPDRKGEHLAVVKSVGIEPRIAGAMRIPRGESIAGCVYESGEPRVVNTPLGPPRESSRYDSDVFASVPLVCQPLVGPDRTIGVLNVTEREDGRPFEPRELKYIQLISSLAATTIDDIMTRRDRDASADSIVVALASLVEYRDTDTRKHMDRVTGFTLVLARELQRQRQFVHLIDAAFLYDLERAVPLHDIGKVAVFDRILLKPGKLTPDEMRQMRRHTEIGAQAIRSIIERVPNVRFLKMAEQIALAHHEHYDGSGYPHHLKGDEIPLSARLTALADVYDAITTRRIYKPALSHETAVAIIRDGSGGQFDPRIVDAFSAREQEFRRISTELADELVALSCPVEAHSNGSLAPSAV